MKSFDKPLFNVRKISNGITAYIIIHHKVMKNSISATYVLTQGHDDILKEIEPCQEKTFSLKDHVAGLLSHSPQNVARVLCDNCKNH